MDKVSIIIPAYNSAKTISKTLESILNQTHTDFEVIIINDGSTDATLEVATKYADKDSRFKIIDKKNEGVSIARNVGINIASGDYITFVDSDDWLEKNYIDVLLNAITSNNSDISKCAFRFISLDTSRSRIRHVPETICTGKEAFVDYLCGKGWMGSACAALYSTNFLRDNNLIFPAGIKIGEDGIFTMRALFAAKKIVSIDVPLLNIAVREKSASRSGVVCDESFKFVDQFCNSETAPYIDAFKLRVHTSNLMRTAYRATYKDFMATYRMAVKENLKQLNNKESRKHLNNIMQLSAMLLKCPALLFYAIKTLRLMGYKPLF